MEVEDPEARARREVVKKLLKKYPWIAHWVRKLDVEAYVDQMRRLREEEDDLS